MWWRKRRTPERVAPDLAEVEIAARYTDGGTDGPETAFERFLAHGSPRSQELNLRAWRAAAAAVHQDPDRVVPVRHRKGRAS